MQTPTYDRIARDRAIIRDVRVTFAHGKRLTGIAQLSASDLETWLREGEITPDAYCACCDEHVSECPEFGHLLIDWPVRTYSTRWGGSGTAQELGLVIFA